MKNEIKNKYPNWCSDSTTKFDLILSDDLDSLLSCLFLQQIKGHKINHFYDFNNLFRSKESTNPTIGVDIDLVRGYCWGNHVTMLTPDDMGVNLNCANLNVINKISKSDYFHKYAGNTILQILSYYEYDISDFSEEAKMILLCIDSQYLGYYSKYENDRNANKQYLCDVLEYEELYKLLKRHSASEFVSLQEKYKLKEKIRIDSEGKLETKIDLNSLSKILNLPFLLPQDVFTVTQSFDNRSYDKPLNVDYKNSKLDKIFSFAVTSLKEVKYSVIK